MKKIPLLDIEKGKSLIPNGNYCYSHTGEMKTVDFYFEGDKKIKCTPYKIPAVSYCPFFSYDKNDNPFCLYLKNGDGLLFDSVKECGINCSDS